MGEADEVLSKLAASWLSIAQGVMDRSVRQHAIARSMYEVSHAELAEALEEVARLAEQTHAQARDVLSAWLPTMTNPEHADYFEVVRELADAEHLLALGRLLRKPKQPGGAEPRDPHERPTANLPPGRTITLGERKSLARGRDRFMIDRLLRDPHPHVIAIVLGNPRVTEDDVIRLAAKRPTFPDVQGEIARSSRFGHRPRVRMALVQNPYTPTTISVPLVSLLLRPDLASVLEATELPPVVRAAAAELLRRRPPVKADGASHDEDPEVVVIGEDEPIQ